MRNVTPIRSIIMACLIAGAAMVASLDVRAQAETRWLKGNLHTHSLWSDGNHFPEMICDWYKQHGYDFVALSDHNILAQGVKWMNVRDINRRGAPLALDEYRKRFGDKWVETRKNDDDQTEVRLKTLAEYRPKLEEPGKFLLIQSEEITDKFANLPVHMNATNLRELIKPQGGSDVRDVMRRNLRAAAEQAQRLNVPMMVHLNHPNFGWAITAEDLAYVVEEPFFEVYNGHPSVHQQGDATHAGIERVWDIANTIRIAELKSPPLMGLATDDSHNYFGVKGASPGRGWVMVRAASLEPGPIIDAMARGDFYASSGVVLDDVRYDAAKATLHITPASDGGATYSIAFIGTRKDYDATTEPVLGEDGKPLKVTHKYSADVGKVLASVDNVPGGKEATYTLTGDELYVRAIITSTKDCVNPVWKDQKQQAWTQPVGFEKWMKPAAGK